MTLILGMICRDRLLFCADREENTEGFGKRSVSKLHEGSGDKWQMLIATSGHGPLADVAAKRVISAARENPSFNLNPQKTIEEVMAEVYGQYVFPRDNTRQRQRDISLIIGITEEEKYRRYLFKTYEDVVKPEGYYACAGAGVDLAYYFLDHCFGDGLSGGEAEVLTAFILREAKASVGGVGLGSEFATVMFDGQYKGMSGTKLVSQSLDWQYIPPFAKVFAPFWKDDEKALVVKPSTAQKLGQRK